MADTTPAPEKQPLSDAEKRRLRREAAQRKLLQSREDRLQRITDLPGASSVPRFTPAPATSDAVVATPSSSHSSDAQSSPVTKRADETRAEAPAPVFSAPPASATAKPVTQVEPKTKVKSAGRARTGTGNNKAPLSFQEQAALAQEQERAYASAIKRWKLIHTAVVNVFAAAMFYLVYTTSSAIHVDGAEVLSNLLYEDAHDMRIPSVNLFVYFLALETTLHTTRFFFDRASTNPPVQPQLGFALPAKLSTWMQTLQNQAFIVQQCFTDFCTLLVVFGVGIIGCNLYSQKALN
ncbi:hypothetical protein RI367_004886 [Sorochytrium milnesiophthora]